ncbi:tetratricopeptide repeat protein [Pseudomarimonas arenosa]|uniref:Tetratricopeptide repeat protein n=1 Tax=Pseudomarimonas arenosa TaxID=2774145 RepID=A0AAW3ZJ90_9GAMM|nr:hypothetical protein [Pseudomarimonas arenosa]MBD8525848.1 hypothetical protein [Pseudomarimonas arenosa]
MACSADLADLESRIATTLDRIECFAYAEAAEPAMELVDSAAERTEVIALLAYFDLQLDGIEAHYRIERSRLPLDAHLQRAAQSAQTLKAELPLALSVKAAGLASAGDLTAARRLCAEGLRQHPADYALSMQLAELERDVDPQAARLLWRQMCQDFPQRARPFYRLGLDAQGDPAERIEALQRAADLASSDGLSQYNCGTQLYLLGADGAAVERLQRAREQLGPSNSVLHNLALALKASGDLQAALDTWLELLQHEPDWSWIVASVAETLAELGRYSDARQHWRHYDEIASPDCEFYPRYLKHLWNYDQFEALRQRSLARLELSVDGDTLMYLGLAEQGLGDHAAALAAFAKARSSSDYYGYVELMAMAQNDLGNPREALALADQALTMRPETGRAIGEKAAALYLLQQDREADALLAGYRGPMRFLYRRCAELMAAQRRFELAAKLFEAQLRVTPKVAHTTSRCADCYRDANQRTRAADLYRQAELLAKAEGDQRLADFCHGQHKSLSKRRRWWPFG